MSRSDIVTSVLFHQTDVQTGIAGLSNNIVGMCVEKVEESRLSFRT